MLLFRCAPPKHGIRPYALFVSTPSSSLRRFVALIYRFPRSSCSRSKLTNSALKLPMPKPRLP